MKYIVKVKPTDKTREWELLESFEYKGWVVPEEFIFDGASIPLGLRWLFPHGGKKFAGACFHDWCYRKQLVTKEIADEAFLDIMLENRVTEWKALAMYYGVKYCGYFAWNARRRQNEER